MACEKCWNDAYVRSRWNGKDQAENYRELLAERKDNPCGPEYESAEYFRRQEAQRVAEALEDERLYGANFGEGKKE